MGLDDLVDDVDEEKTEEQAEGILNELGIEDTEELRKFEQRFDNLNHALAYYDKKLEELQARIERVEKIIENETVVEAVKNDLEAETDDTKEETTPKEEDDDSFGWEVEEIETDEEDDDSFSWDA